MKSAFGVALLLQGLIAALGEADSAGAEQCPVVPESLQKAMIRHIGRIHADEYCAARTWRSDGQLSVLIYTAEGACGSNLKREAGTCSLNWVRYMVGEYKGQPIPPIAVGGKGGLSDERLLIENGVVMVSGMKLGPSDPSCCPSVPAKRMFRVSAGRFVEVAP